MTPPPIGGAGMSPAGMTLPGMGSAGIGGSGTSSMPGSSFPGMGPASIPAIPDPTFSTPTFEQIYSCSSCGARISQAEVSLSKCPHCGITWGYKLDQFGNKTMTSAGGNLATVGIVIVIFVLLGVIVFIALFVGIIVAIVKATAAPARPPQPQRYY